MGCCPHTHDTRYCPIAQRDKRHNQAIPTKLSAKASVKAVRGAPAPPVAPMRWRTKVVRPGATIWGSTTARFQMPIAAAIAPAGRTRHAIAQSATRKTPQPRPAISVAHTIPPKLWLPINRPRAKIKPPTPIVATSRLSRRSLGRAAIAAPSVPTSVKDTNQNSRFASRSSQRRRSQHRLDVKEKIAEQGVKPDVRLMPATRTSR